MLHAKKKSIIHRNQHSYKYYKYPILPTMNNIVASSLITLLGLFVLCENVQLYSIFQNKYDKI